MRLTSEQIQQVLEGAIRNIMEREGCDRRTAMDAIEKNGVRVKVTSGNEAQTLRIRFPEKLPPFQQND